MDNIEAETYRMLNELAVRVGLRPNDFCAELKEYPPKLCHVLEFEFPLTNDEQLKLKLRTMLMQLGMNPDEGQELIGNRDKIYESLVHALECVPAKAKSQRGR